MWAWARQKVATVWAWAESCYSQGQACGTGFLPLDCLTPVIRCLSLRSREGSDHVESLLLLLGTQGRVRAPSGPAASQVTLVGNDQEAIVGYGGGDLPWAPIPFGCCRQYCYACECANMSWRLCFQFFGCTPRGGISGLQECF